MIGTSETCTSSTDDNDVRNRPVVHRLKVPMKNHRFNFGGRSARRGAILPLNHGPRDLGLLDGSKPILSIIVLCHIHESLLWERGRCGGTGLKKRRGSHGERSFQEVFRGYIGSQRNFPGQVEINTNKVPTSVEYRSAIDITKGGIIFQAIHPMTHMIVIIQILVLAFQSEPDEG